MNILVSINCITYNHEKYIAQALDSFLMQKTNFDYEIIIGEDCSTDGTMEIVQRYVKSYPEKIILVTSNSNVGWRENTLRLHRKSRGKYIAICEGDDFWTDPNKLQKQVDYMQNNPECTLCFHNSWILDLNTLERTLFYNENIESQKFDIGDMVEMFIPTASRVYLKGAFDNIPSWYFDCIVGDLPSQLIQTYQGYAYYMSDIMSTYRRGVENSATQTLFEKNRDIKKIVDNDNNMINMLNRFNEYTNGRYKDNVDRRKEEFEFRNALLLKDKKALKRILCKKPMLYRIKIYFQLNYPRLYKKLKSLFK